MFMALVSKIYGHSLSRLSIACDIKLEGALYSVFYAETSKRLTITLGNREYLDVGS